MIYAFGPFRYDADQRLLFREGELVAVAPKTLDTLHVLLERRGRVVEKPELMKLVWPGTHVEEAGLARNISLLRKALGDDSDENPYIATIPRRGYRFAAEISTDEPEAPSLAEAKPGTQRVSRRWWPLGLVCLSLMAAAGFYQFYVPSRFAQGGARAAGLAVVPFECACPGMDGPRFSLGLNDQLVTELSKRDGLEVTGPSTVRRYQWVGASMSLMGRLLALDVLVEGTIQKLGDRLRITARMVDVHTGRVIWAETYDGSAADSGGTQAAVARAAAQAIGDRLTVSANR